jgi:hypothetical protein
MSDTTNTAPSGADAAAPAPKSDAEAALQAQATPEAKPEPTEEQKAAEQAEKQRQEEEGKKKNRTREYIVRLQSRVAELESRLHSQVQVPQSNAHRASPNQSQGEARPTLADYGYDFNAWQQADTEWVDRQAERRAAELFDKRATQARQQETVASYESKIAAFAEQAPDFYEVVGSIDPAFLPSELQAAIMAHPDGPAIAYHLGTNDEALWNLASIRADLLPAAVQRLAARLGAAPAPQGSPAPAITPTKPITQAPRPAPTVGGRAPVSVDPERMTTDQWLEWRQAQLKKKG